MNDYEWPNVMPARIRDAKSRQRVHEAIVLYMQANPAVSYTAVGELFGYTDQGIRKIAEKAGLPSRARPEGGGRSLEILAYARENPGMTLEKIGLHFNLTRERIRQILAKAGISGPERVAERQRHGMEAVVDYAKAHPEQSWDEIAKAFDISPWKAKRHADRAGYVKPHGTARMEAKALQARQFDRRNIAAYYAEHPEMTMQAIADHFGMTIQTLIRILEHTGSQRRGYEGRVGAGASNLEKWRAGEGMSSAEKAEVVEYLREFPDLSHREIGEAFGISTALVGQISIRAGLRRRAPHMGVDKEAEEEYWETPWGYRNPLPSWNIEKHRWE